jgi:hypothetical protein
VNEHLFRLGGYDLLYGATKHPVAEWFMRAEKKKKPLGDIVVASRTGEEMCLIRQRVSSHYIGNVGLAYNICTALTLKCTNAWAEYDDADKRPGFKSLQHATNVAWRRLYEDMGLSGYTPEAATLFNGLRFGVSGKLSLTDDGYPSPAGPEATRQVATHEWVAGRLDETLSVGAWLVRGQQLASTWGYVERNGLDELPAWRQPILREAVAWGALRRLGQGRDDVDVQDEQEGGVMSLWTACRLLNVLDKDVPAGTPRLVHHIMLRQALSLGGAIWDNVRQQRQEADE